MVPLFVMVPNAPSRKAPNLFPKIIPDWLLARRIHDGGGLRVAEVA
jgi:hypothetical protein